MSKYVIAAAIAGAIVVGMVLRVGLIAPPRPVPVTMGSDPIALKVAVTKGGAASDSAAQAPAPAAALTAPQIARTGTVSLYTGNVNATVNWLAAMARRYGGQVFSLQISSANGAAAASATMELRVPASRFDDAMSGIVRAGKVRERSEGAQDLTGSLTDGQARLVNLRRTEADMRRIMDRSGSVEEILDVENQLSQVREQIETLESELKATRAQVAYSTIHVDVADESGAPPIEPTPLAQLGTALRAALHSMTQTTIALAAALLWLLVYAPYAIVFGVVAIVVYRRVRRRVPLPG